jgi:dienelactone hydrolase
MRRQQLLKNVADTESYTVFDHVLSQTVRTLSRVVGVRRITQPFWARWRASGIDEAILFQFLDEVGTIDRWASAASKIIAEQIEALKIARSSRIFSKPHLVKRLRDLSYLCHMAQWGSLPLNDQRRELYRQSRDYYLEAESLEFGKQYTRVVIPWKSGTFTGNLHRQDKSAPLVVIVHGMDGCKEEYLSTELALFEKGFSVLCLDGPGQGETLLLEGMLWDAAFPEAISAALDFVAADDKTKVTAIGALGISAGGQWVLRCAAVDNRISAVFDLGGPLSCKKFQSFPFLVKTRIWQMAGAQNAKDLEWVFANNSIEDESLIAKVDAHVRIVHGSRDRVVSVTEKSWLLDKLKSSVGANREPSRQLSMRVIEGGDHCCTAHADVVREDLLRFFSKALQLNGRVPQLHSPTVP